MTTQFQSLDAVITGCAFEIATTALRVLEEGKNTTGWINPEMLATLDNFINVVLFNERIYVTGTADLQDNHFVPRNYKNEAGPIGKQYFDAAEVFFPVPRSDGNSQSVPDRIARIISPVQTGAPPLFTIRCHFTDLKRTIFQELVYLDAYFIEFAINQFGAERFKPVFPGEHLYLGLRHQRVAVPQATHTMADMPGQRLRTLVRERMVKMNEFVSQGAPMLPELTPMFVSRILKDSAKGADLVPALMELRNSQTMKRFRQWLISCSELSRSEDYAQREKAMKALRKLHSFSFEADLSVIDFGKSLLNIAKNVVKAEPLSIVEDIAPDVMRYLAAIPLSGLRTFGRKNVDPMKLQAFLKSNFGDQLNRVDMDSIAVILQLPSDLSDWQGKPAELSAQPQRVDSAPPLSRPYRMELGAAANVNTAKRAFDDYWETGVRVTRELLRKSEKETKKK